VFQLREAARKDVGLKGDSVDDHIDAGVRYLKMQADRHDGDWDQAIASYKQGAGSLAKNGEQPDTAEYKQKVYGFGHKLAAGALKLGGAATGAIGGAALTGPETLGIGALPGAMAGAAAGYGLGSTAAEKLGLQEPSSLGDKAVEGGRVGLDVVGGMAGGVPGFLAADTAGKIAQDKFRSGGESEILAPSETNIAGSKPFNFPGGDLAQNAATNLAFEGLAKGIGKSTQAYRGYSAAKAATEEAATESAKTLADEQAAQAAGVEQPIGKQQVKQARADAAFTGQAEAQLEAAKRQTQIQEGPAQAQRQFEAMVGPKPDRPPIEPGMGGITSPAEEAYKARQAQAVFAPEIRIQKELGEGYEKLLEPHGDKPVDVKGLERDSLAQQLQLEQWGKLQDLSPNADEVLQEARNIGYRFVDGQRLPTPVTMRDLMVLRSHASELFAKGATPLDQAVGRRVVDNTLRSMEESGFATQELKALNGHYKSFRDIFSGVDRQVSKGEDPTQWGGRVFTKGSAAVRLWDQATAEEREPLRSAMGEWIYEQPNMRDALNKIGKEALGRYFGNGPLADSRIWLETQPKLVEFDRLVNESPQAREAFTNNVNRRFDAMIAKRTNASVDQALALAEKLGPAGRDIHRQIVAAPQAQKGQLASDFLESINPQKAAEKFKATQQTPDALTIKAMGNISPRAYKKAIAYNLLRSAAIGAASHMYYGHMGIFTMGAMAANTMVLPHYIAKEAFINSLRNPETAAAFLRAIRSGKTEKMGQIVADTAIAMFDAKQKDKQ
jgi:hypothetical protein